MTDLTDAVRAHATVLPRIDDAGDAELSVLDEAIGDARVVGVGEGVHFVAEFAAAQRRLIRYLAERHGFTVVAHEFGFAEGERLDAWVRGATAELVVHDGPNDGFDATRDRWRWLREYNAERCRPLRFAGLDTPVAGGSLRPVLEPLVAFLQRADPEVVELARTAEDLAYRFEAQSQAGSAPLWAALPAAERSLLTATLSRLSLRMDALRPVYLQHTGRADVDLARRHLDVAMAADHMVGTIHALLQGGGSVLDTSVRDRLMADSLLWHLDRLGPDDRVVLVAHNAHLQKTADHAIVLGSFLADALGGDYRAIALTHTAASAPELHMTDANALGFDVRDTPVAPPSPTSVEGALTAAGLGDVTTVLPLGPLRGGPAPTGLRAQSAEAALDVPAAFDAVVTTPTATTTEHVTLY